MNLGHRPLRVLVAPDKFKGTLTAAEATKAIVEGIREARPDAVISSMPVADGGEGTVEALLGLGARRHEVVVSGPLGAPTPAHLALIGTTAFIESSQACGLQLLVPSAQTAVAAHSHGVGELVAAALDLGCDRVVVGVGGVACTDGGAGMATALGARLLDVAGDPVEPGGGGLSRVETIDLTGLDPRLPATTIVAACDVTSPLVGPHGAAAVFAPQKGAGPGEVEQLAHALERYAAVVARDTGVRVTDIPGGGAAGGLAAGMVGLIGAEIASGCETVLELLGFSSALHGMDVVVTGEGSLDRQTLTGKAPAGVARLARRHGIGTIALAGVVDVGDRAELEGDFESVWSMVEHVGAERALTDARSALTSLAAEVFRLGRHRALTESPTAARP